MTARVGPPVAVFELGGALAAALPELAIGPWTRSPPGIAAFSAAADQPASVWRIDLARYDAASRHALDGGQRSVTRAHAVLDDVPRRLDRAIDRARAEIAAAAGPDQARGAPGFSRYAPALPSYAPALPAPAPALPSPALPSIDAGLVAALARAEAPPIEPGSIPAWPAEAANASGSSGGPGRLERALQRVADLVHGRARIETRVEGLLVARSITTLSGDSELWIVPRLPVAVATLHMASVAVAVRTRHAWLRTLALVATCCGRLAALGLPPTGVAALPVVWGFLRDVLREVRDLSAGPGGAAPAAAR